MPYEDVQVQLIDTPPVAHEPFDPLLVNIARNADAILLVLDATDPDGLEQVATLGRFCARSRIVPAGRAIPEEMGISARSVPMHVALNKVDAAPGAAGSAGPGASGAERIEVLRAALGEDLPFHRVSARTGAGLEDLRERLFRTLGVIRVYAKEPGKKEERERPFLLKRGATVIDLAQMIHKDVARAFKFARVWGSSRFQGQPVERTHVLADGDVVEIHS
jgi:ribosome-interacting GTPase 1